MSAPMNIDKIREALEDKVRKARAYFDGWLSDQPDGSADKAAVGRYISDLLNQIEALAELDKAQQPAEPVAWMRDDAPPQDAFIFHSPTEPFNPYFTTPLYTHPPQAARMTVDELASIIRKVDGNHTLGAGALAEAIIAAIEAKQHPNR